MDKTSYDIVGDAVSKFWREKCFPMDVVCFFYQKYDYWQDDEWEWREEFASPVSDSDYDKVLFQNDFCEGQSVVKDLVIVPFDEVTGYYTKNVIVKDNPKTEIDDRGYAEAINKIRESMLVHKPQVQVLEEKTGHAVYNSFDDPTDIVEFINEHHIKKEDIVGIVRRDSVCLGSNLFKYYLIYFEEVEE